MEIIVYKIQHVGEEGETKPYLSQGLTAEASN